MVTTRNMKIRSQEADCQVAFQSDQPHHPNILYCKPTGGFSCWPCRPSCDDYPHIWPAASAIPEASQMVFCHESLQGLEDQVFLQHQGWTLETFIYGGCLGNQNSFHTSQDGMKSCRHVSRSQRWEKWQGSLRGEGLGKQVELRAPHLHGVFPPCCVPGEAAELSCETTRRAHPSGASLAEGYPLECPSW